MRGRLAQPAFWPEHWLHGSRLSFDLPYQIPPLQVLPAGILLAQDSGKLAHGGPAWALTLRFHCFYTYHVRIW